MSTSFYIKCETIGRRSLLVFYCMEFQDNNFKLLLPKSNDFVEGYFDFSSFGPIENLIA